MGLLATRLQDAFWARWGARACYVLIGAFVTAAILLVLASFNIGLPASPSYTSDFSTNVQLSLQEIEGRWRASELWSNLAFGIGVLMFVPIGLALRDLLRPDHPAASVVSTGMVVGAIIGLTSVLFDIGLNESTFAIAGDITDLGRADQDLPALSQARFLLERSSDWMDVGFFVLTGASIAVASVIARDAGWPTGWRRMSLVATFFLALVGITTLTGPQTLFQASAAVGGAVVAPIWAGWTAKILRRRVSPGPRLRAVSNPN